MRGDLLEKWKPVVNYEKDYLVSNKGRIKSLKNNKTKILKTFLNNQGYPRINLMRYGKLKQVFVHRLVVQSFIGNIRKGKHVNHIDGVKCNNNVDNLEIVTAKENAIHASVILGHDFNPVYMLNPDTLEPTKEFFNTARASEETGINETSIYRVCYKERHYAGGYVWCLKSDYNENTKENIKNRLKSGYGRKKIYQINQVNGKVIAEFDSLQIAIDETGFESIRHCATGYCKTAGGYKWTYKKPIT